MNVEFHYHALYFICRRAGFPEGRAATIAASSQRVDDAVIPYEIVDPAGRAFSTLVTQDYAFWDESTSRDVYLPFHFIPAGGQAAAGASRHATAADCPSAKALLVAALRSRDDYRVGVALHAYADTWAHQGFSGLRESANALDPASPLPAVGHLQALKAPDDPGAVWEDPRLGPGRSRVVNADRFLAAARKIYRYLRTSIGLGFEEEELALEPLARLWRRDSGPEERIADYAVELEVPPYDRREWIAAAGLPRGIEDEAASAGYDRVLRLASGLRGRAAPAARAPIASASFLGSPLHRWDLAARAHLEAARSLLAGEGLL